MKNAKTDLLSKKSHKSENSDKVNTVKKAPDDNKISSKKKMGRGWFD